MIASNNGHVHIHIYMGDKPALPNPLHYSKIDIRKIHIQKPKKLKDSQSQTGTEEKRPSSVCNLIIRRKSTSFAACSIPQSLRKIKRDNMQLSRINFFNLGDFWDPALNSRPIKSEKRRFSAIKRYDINDLLYWKMVIKNRYIGATNKHVKLKRNISYCEPECISVNRVQLRSKFQKY